MCVRNFFTFGPLRARRPAVQNVFVIAQSHGVGHASPIEAGVNLAVRKIRFVINGGVSEPFAICQIINIILLFYSTFSFCAIIGVKDRILYLI